MRTFTERLDLHLKKSAKVFIVKIKRAHSFKSMNQAVDFIISDYERAIAEAKTSKQKEMESRNKEIKAKLELSNLTDVATNYLENHAQANESRVVLYEFLNP